ERFVATFAGQPADDVTTWIDQISRGPGVNRILVPDFKISVVDDRMLDLVTQNYAAEVLSIFFIIKFGGVDADDHEFIRILLLELFQIRNDVHAVDAAVGPKVQQHNFAFQP